MIYFYKLFDMSFGLCTVAKINVKFCHEWCVWTTCLRQHGNATARLFGHEIYISFYVFGAFSKMTTMMHKTLKEIDILSFPEAVFMCLLSARLRFVTYILF